MRLGLCQPISKYPDPRQDFPTANRHLVEKFQINISELEMALSALTSAGRILNGTKWIGLQAQRKQRVLFNWIQIEIAAKRHLIPRQFYESE